MKIVDKISFSKLADPLRGKDQLRGMGPGYDRSIVSLQATDGRDWKTLIGPESITALTGIQYDEDGNPVGSGSPYQPYVSPTKGLRASGAWTNTLPSGMDNFADDRWTKRGTASVDNGDGSYRITLGSIVSKDMYHVQTSTAGSCRLYIQAKLVSGTGSLTMRDASGADIPEVYELTEGQWAECYGSILTGGLGHHLYSTDGSDLVVDIRRPMFTIGASAAYLYGYIPPGITNSASSSTTGGNGTNTALDAKMTAALSGGPFSAVASIYPGASSAQVTADANVLSVRNVVADLIYLASGGVIKASDGTNTATVAVTDGWLQTDRLNIFFRTNAAGTQMQIGYTKNLDQIITWGELATYKGTMAPGTHLRYALNGTSPESILLADISGKSLGDLDLLKTLRYIK